VRKAGAKSPPFIPEAEYERIKRQMPIPCVDLIVVDASEQILLLLRANDPARGCWWMPGGRVGFGETRVEAAVRKLYEEAQLAADEVRELATFDLILGNDNTSSHGITTVYQMCVSRASEVVLDRQSDAAQWRSREQWLRDGLHPFVQQCLRLL